MKSGVKYALVFFGALALIFAVGAGAIIYRTRYEKTEVVSFDSPDGGYRLTVYQIGDPDWPFGATHCRFVLYNGEEEIGEYKFEIHNDGCSASAGSFSISWDEDCATVVSRGKEQRDMVYEVRFDGETRALTER